MDESDLEKRTKAYFEAGNFTSILELFGATRLPPRIKRVIIDVGWQYKSEYEWRYNNHPDVLLLGFEALPETWEMADAVKANRGVLSCPNGCVVVLPLAISNANATFVEFNAAGGDMSGCDSLLPARRPQFSVFRITDWPCLLSTFTCSLSGPLNAAAEARCARVGRALAAARRGLHTALDCMYYHAPSGVPGTRVQVPSVSLETVLAELPLDVSLVKVDAQGADLRVVATLGSSMARVERVQMEMQDLPDDDPLRMYEGGVSRSRMDVAMEELGFRPDHCDMNNCAIAEMNCFYRNKVQPALLAREPKASAGAGSTAAAGAAFKAGGK